MDRSQELVVVTVLLLAGLGLHNSRVLAKTNPEVR